MNCEGNANTMLRVETNVPGELVLYIVHLYLSSTPVDYVNEIMQSRLHRVTRSPGPLRVEAMTRVGVPASVSFSDVQRQIRPLPW